MSDTERTLKASKHIIDGRNYETDFGSILVTLDHTVATVLLTCCNNDVQKAARILNEVLVQHVEIRLSKYHNDQLRKSS